MRQAFYKRTTEVAEQFIREQVRLGHYDEAYGAYQLWKRMSAQFVSKIPSEDSRRLFELSQHPHASDMGWQRALA